MGRKRQRRRRLPRGWGHELRGVTVNDGESQGEFNLSFCFSGPKDRVLQNEARLVVATLHMRSDPKAAGLENG